MTCKDCIHQSACLDWCRGFGQEVEFCEHFSNKLGWIYLPLKVGDEVYCFEPDFEVESRPKLHVVKRKILNVETFLSVCGGTYGLKDVGKSVFLTKEEAEKVLEKKRKQYD